ncbi:cleavage stimulation factor subunit 2 [Sarcoptes scabiei]|nr:cleavage stimulation factor subunit 2 [Sarcoptes scabiei]
MSVPPPPPPPVALFGGKSNSSGFPCPPSSINQKKSLNRDALLSEIRTGTKLKKTAVINDRSSPLIMKSSSSNDNSTSGSTITNASPLGLGGLFANGMPKLRSTGSSLLPDKSSSSSTNDSVNHRISPPKKYGNSSKTINHDNLKRNSYSSQNTNSSQNLAQTRNRLEQLFGGSGNIASVSENATKSVNSLISATESGDSSSPNRTNIKPNPSQKYHTLNTRNNSSKLKPSPSSDNMPAHKGQAPQPPSQQRSDSKPNLQRSNSRPNALQKPSIKPPNAKPPPPPKQSELSNKLKFNVATDANVNQRTSNSEQNRSALHNFMNTQLNITSNSNKPPAPPRNSSYPNISSVTSNNSSPQTKLSNNPSTNNHHPTHGKVLKPLCPPPPPPPNRNTTIKNNNVTNTIGSNYSTKNVVDTGHHHPHFHNHRSKTGSVLKPAPPTPLQLSSIESNFENESRFQNDNQPPPPPPIRNASMMNNTVKESDNFHQRFADRFRDLYQLPAPLPFRNLAPKIYPSQIANKNRRREPPPPPPPTIFNFDSNGSGNDPISSTINHGPTIDQRFHIRIDRQVNNY